MNHAFSAQVNFASQRGTRQEEDRQFQRRLPTQTADSASTSKIPSVQVEDGIFRNGSIGRHLSNGKKTAMAEIHHLKAKPHQTCAICRPLIRSRPWAASAPTRRPVQNPGQVRSLFSEVDSSRDFASSLFFGKDPQTLLRSREDSGLADAHENLESGCDTAGSSADENSFQDWERVRLTVDGILSESCSTETESLFESAASSIEEPSLLSSAYEAFRSWAMRTA